LHYDSTVYGNNGTALGGVNQNALGMIDGADLFAPPEQYVQGTSFSLSDQYTVGMWFKANSLTNPQANWQCLFQMGASSTNRIMFYLEGDEFGSLGHRTSGYTESSDVNLAVDTWYYGVFKFNYSATPQIRMFVDGKEVTLVNNNGIGHTPSLSGNWRIGTDTHVGTDYTFNGTIDEVRISNPVRSDSWINSSYENQKDPTQFYSVGSEETVPAEDTIPPEISDVTITKSDPIDTDPSYGWENISCTVTDVGGVDKVKLNITYPDMHTENVSMTKSGDTYYNNTTFSNVGSYSYFIWANDTSNNVNTSSVDTFAIPPNWDINEDGHCDGWDLMAMQPHWQDTGSLGWIRSDVNNDGSVNGWDLMAMQPHWQESWP